MATYVTVSQLTSRLIRLSGQVPGTGVQVFSTDVFADMINTTLRSIARRHWWPHFMDWRSVVTDVTTGIPTTDLTSVADHTDIKAIYAADCPDPLPYVTDSINPQQYGSGTSAVAYEALPLSNTLYSKRIIRVYPFTSQDTLNLRVRIVPDTLGQNDIVPLDQDLILFGALWAYFEDEGDNPQQAKKYQGLFDAKFTELVSATANHRVALTDRVPSGDRWITGTGAYTTQKDLTGEY